MKMIKAMDLPALLKSRIPMPPMPTMPPQDMETVSFGLPALPRSRMPPHNRPRAKVYFYL